MTMKYTRVETAPGQTILRLTEEWAGLPAGTEVTPLWAGYNNVTGRAERTVTVVSGDRRGEQVTGRR